MPNLAMRRILVPMDFSPEAMHAAQYAVILGQQLDAQLTLLHVWQEPAYMGPEAAAQIQPVGPLSLHAFAEQQTKQPIHACVRQLAKTLGVADPKGFMLTVDIAMRVEVGEPVDTILHVAHEEKSDLIVMGTHQRKREWQRLFHSCVAEQVRWNAACPVLLLVVPPAVQKKTIKILEEPVGQVATGASLMAHNASLARGGVDGRFG